jgi:beta-glucosidase
VSLAHTPRPKLPGLGTPWGTPTTIRYNEGAEVGYRWYAQKGIKPLYAFGHGLSYTSFAYKNLKVSGGETVTATFTVTNTGKRAGADVPQVYLTGAGDTKRMRLLGFERVELQPGESKEVTVSADRGCSRASTARPDSGASPAPPTRSRSASRPRAPVLSAETRLQARLFGS